MDLLAVDNDKVLELGMVGNVPCKSDAKVLHIVLDGPHRSRMASGKIATNSGAAALG